MITEEYRLVRSKRKTIGLEIRDGRLTVRAPYGTTEAMIRKVLEERENWIRKCLTDSREQQSRAAENKLTAEEIRELAERARRVIPERVRYYAPLVGVTYGRITIRNQRGRWGSCSSKGNLNFNCLLMLTPPEVLDSVVVHELCHRKEMNHSERFYAEVLRVYPEYRKWQTWLKKNGPEIIARMRE